eukprot:jgi/Chlat1/4582/Chrsp290S04330
MDMALGAMVVGVRASAYPAPFALAIPARASPQDSYQPYFFCKATQYAANNTIATPLSTSVTYTARNFADRIATVAGSYLIDQDPAKLAASWGYDWLYDNMTNAQRTQVWNAVLNNAFNPVMQANMLPVLAKVTSNINPNSLTGFILAAVVFAESNMDLCQQVLTQSLPGLELAVSLFEATGASYEGPYYASYIGMNLPHAIDALQLGLNKDYGFGTRKALRSAAYVRIQSISPSLRTFSYADGLDAVNSNQLSYYAALRFQDPFLVYNEAALQQTGLWFRVFWAARIPALAFMRTSWTDSNGVYVAVRAGANPSTGQSSHAHLDLGSFVFDHGGHRWFIDLGLDNYGLPGYFTPGNQRYAYYRTRTEGHNTMAISNATQAELRAVNQEYSAVCPITSMYSSSARSHTIIDLTQAYSGAQYAARGIALIKDVPAPNARLLVQDEVRFSGPVDILSMYHTRATIQEGASGSRTILLSQDGGQLNGQILSPNDAYFEIWSCNPFDIGRENEDPNTGVVNIVVRSAMRTAATVAVLWSTSLMDAPMPVMQPLSSWMQ